MSNLNLFNLSIRVALQCWLLAAPGPDGIQRQSAPGWPTPKGLYWLNPVMAFSILVGLSLDYDLYASLRIAEFRALGYSSTSAIRKGAWKTGFQ
jgi:hypothetical protein